MMIEKGNVKKLDKDDLEFLIDLIKKSDKDFTFAHTCMKCGAIFGQSSLKYLDFYDNTNRPEEETKCRKCGNQTHEKKIFYEKDLIELI